MAGWLELSKSSDDQCRFAPKAGNGGIVLTSELYTTKGAAGEGTAFVHTNNPLDEYCKKKTASNGKLHFNLKAANRQITGSSQPYVDEQSRKTGIALVKTNGVGQTIKDKI